MQIVKRTGTCAGYIWLISREYAMQILRKRKWWDGARTYTLRHEFSTYNNPTLGHQAIGIHRYGRIHSQCLVQYREQVLQFCDAVNADLVFILEPTSNLGNKLTHLVRVAEQEVRNTREQRRSRLTAGNGQRAGVRDHLVQCHASEFCRMFSFDKWLLLWFKDWRRFGNDLV